jgi:hypothetical protein
MLQRYAGAYQQCWLASRLNPSMAKNSMDDSNEEEGLSTLRFLTADTSALASSGSDGIVRVGTASTGVATLIVHMFDSADYAVEIDGDLTSCTPGAWRWLGWLAPSPTTGALTRYPAEIFGPLPVIEVSEAASAQTAAVA